MGEVKTDSSLNGFGGAKVSLTQSFPTFPTWRLVAYLKPNRAFRVEVVTDLWFTVQFGVSRICRGEVTVKGLDILAHSGRKTRFADLLIKMKKNVLLTGWVGRRTLTAGDRETHLGIIGLVKHAKGFVSGHVWWSHLLLCYYLLGGILMPEFLSYLMLWPDSG